MRYLWRAEEYVGLLARGNNLPRGNVNIIAAAPPSSHFGLLVSMGLDFGVPMFSMQDMPTFTRQNLSF
jgi:hypothetical protein